MREDFQLARSMERRYGVAANDCVVGAATHALVLKDWSIKNTPLLHRMTTLSSVDTFTSVLDSVDHFFASFRASTGVQTGYSQLVIRPVGWGDRWEAYLPHVDIVSVRSYPYEFENWGWLKKPPVLNEEDCKDVGVIYLAISNSSSNQLSLAARRLNAAYLRRSEEDAILDVTIGLETLLVSDSRTGEITYKLSLRLGALCKLQPFAEYTPAQVFAMCKKIYDFRSAVVHGSHEVGKKRSIKIENVKQPVEAVNLGVSLLRYAITSCCNHPEYLKPSILDLTLFDNHSQEI